MTKRLYHENSYIREFKATIISCTPYDNNYALILDKTYFYPEGGGQPSDSGTIDNWEVLNVIEEEGQMLHIIAQELNHKNVECKIDWNRRYDLMQQHTGQHILSHCFLELFNGKTDSFHLGDNSVSIEININDFDHNRCNIIEDMANEIIYSNLPISAIIVHEEELQKFPLRKQPSVKDQIRIVKIGDIDYSPCGGTHVMNTGEVGIIKIIRWEKLKESYRFEFLCGGRALKDYRYKNTLLLSLCARFSVKDYDLDKVLIKLADENKTLRKDNAYLKRSLIKYEAEELYNQGEVIQNTKIIKWIFKGRKIDEIKLLATEITSHPRTISLLGAINDTAQIVFSRSDDVDIDINLLLKTVLPIVDGKGGGSSKTAQGGGNATQNLDNLIEKAYNLVLSKI
ncbi:MAG: DHHA1 domain-containing protein [Lutispora sp.]|nr:DHHA1 domain-containing protein [Lutispora sp.]MDD4833356.1 DHHA1 domain-containing protein [Lutispora sp.]